ncbi:MAG: polysaccharide biosynthesis/export family protein [Hyphomicrobium sp.]
MSLRRSLLKLAPLCGAALLSLQGCASDPFVAVEAAAGSIVQAISMPADAGPVEAGPDNPVHTASQESFGLPPVVPAAFNGPQAVADTDGPYLLDSGDRLRVFVYGQPNLSRGYTVDHDGNITVPLIGNVHARGRTTQDLEHVIRRELAAEYVRDPQVTVDMQQNRPFFILGEVKNAGQYPYVSGMTVETAIAIAGGYSERASSRKFRISRRINGFVEQIEAPSDYVVFPGDTVYVFERFF